MKRKGYAYRYNEEHVHAGADVLEPACIVGEFITGICIGGIPEENALNLAWT